MEKIIVKGGQKLSGTVSASGAKNTVLPIMFATLLSEGRHTIHNVPELKDVYSAIELLESLGCSIEFKDHTLTIDVVKVSECYAPYDLVRKMRASILCLGPLLTKYGSAKVSLPGGCAIGTRPINIHLDAMTHLGAQVSVEGGYVFAHAKKLKGDTVLFDMPSVGATENLLMAAVLAEGTTVIENAAREPEIVDLCIFLNKMGAKITGEGSGIITIEGVTQLQPVEHTVISDRIEAGTLLIAGAITGGEVTVTNCSPDHLEALIQKLKEIGFELTTTENSISIKSKGSLKSVDMTTAPHPGFPTDLQAQFMTLMTQIEGTSLITETIFENRFMHVQELMRLNADITPKTRVAVVRGKKGNLTGAPVMATDLRASASLVLAGLVAEGETTVNRIYHLDRGYEKLEQKLTQLGADITRV